MDDQAREQRIKEIMQEQNLDYFDACEIYIDEKLKRSIEEDEEREEQARERLKNGPSPKVVIIAIHDDLGRNKLVALQIAKRKINVASHHVINIISRGERSRWIVACEAEINQETAHRIFAAVEDDDLYSEEEVELIVTEHHPFDIRSKG